jgi:hypothetical protein
MLEFFYTGAFKCGDVQSNPIKSLGGYCSSSKVPSFYQNNLFSSITPYSILKNKIELIGLILKNSYTRTLTNINISTITPSNSYAKFELAFVALAQDNNGWYMEKIPNKNSIPYTATFYDIENGVNLPDLIQDGRIGIWVKRILNQSNIINLNDDDKLYNNYKNGVVLSVEEKIDIKVVFD